MIYVDFVMRDFVFLPKRSAGNILWAYQWKIAVDSRMNIATCVLGIDIFKPFDNVDRLKLLKVLKSKLN